MPGIRGIGRSFKLSDAGGGSPFTMVDISAWLKSAEPSNSTDEYDGTTYQPGVLDPMKDMRPGFSNRAYALGGLWSKAVEDFFSGDASGSPPVVGVNGVTGLAYEDGPEGTAVGNVRISGLCNCSGYSGPKPPVDGLITWDATLKQTTRIVDTF